MEKTRFDSLLRHAVRQPTRREALAALVGGALLLDGAATTEATKQAQRRKERRRKARKRSAAIPEYVSFRVRNYTDRQMTYSTGRKDGYSSCCRYISDWSMAPGGYSQDVFTSFANNPWIWLDDGKYWFEFAAPWAYGPIAKIAVNGRFAPPSNCCNGIPFGQTVHHRFELPRREGQSVEINIAGKVFSIERDQNDDDLHRFTIHIPPDA